MSTQAGCGQLGGGQEPVSEVILRFTPPRATGKGFSLSGELSTLLGQVTPPFPLLPVSTSIFFF